MSFAACDTAYESQSWRGKDVLFDLHVVFFYLLSSFPNLSILIQHLANRFNLSCGLEGALHDSLLILTKSGSIQDIDKQLKSNLALFNSRFRDVSSFAISTDRILFVSGGTLYSSHPRLTPHSILPTSLHFPITSVVMGEHLAIATDYKGQVYVAGNTSSTHDSFHFE